MRRILTEIMIIAAGTAFFVGVAATIGIPSRGPDPIPVAAGSAENVVHWPVELHGVDIPDNRRFMQPWRR